MVEIGFILMKRVLHLQGISVNTKTISEIVEMAILTKEVEEGTLMVVVTLTIMGILTMVGTLAMVGTLLMVDILTTTLILPYILAMLSIPIITITGRIILITTGHLNNSMDLEHQETTSKKHQLTLETSKSVYFKFE